MAIKGLSIPVFGKYTNTNGKITYIQGKVNPHAISYSVAVESTENNPLHGDNRVIENDVGKFKSGTLSLETDDLDAEISMFILGLKQITENYGESKTATVLVYDDNQDSPDMGFGIIEEHQIDDEPRYKAVMLCRVVFSIPEDAATTRGESVEWQTRTIEGSIMRSEEATTDVKYPWKKDAWFDTESEALEYLKAVLGVSDTV